MGKGTFQRKKKGETKKGEPLTWEDELRAIHKRFNSCKRQFDVPVDGDKAVEKLFAEMIERPKAPNKFVCSHRIGQYAARSLVMSLGVSPFKGLKSVCFWNAGIGDLGTEALARCLPDLKDCINLEIIDCGVTAKGCHHLSTALSHRSNAHLAILTLDHNSIGTDGMKELAEGLRFNTTLRELNLAHCDIQSDGGVHIATLLNVQVTDLKLLNLNGNALNEAGVFSILSALSRHPKLTSINLAQNGFREVHCVDQLSRALRHNPRLTHIDIDGNCIGDAGGQAILKHLHDVDHIMQFIVTPFMSKDIFNDIASWVQANQPQKVVKRKKKKANPLAMYSRK